VPLGGGSPTLSPQPTHSPPAASGGVSNFNINFKPTPDATHYTNTNINTNHNNANTNNTNMAFSINNRPVDGGANGQAAAQAVANTTNQVHDRCTHQVLDHLFFNTLSKRALGG
jgi:hypothetical protein